jgi:hypothetical protein
MCCFNYQDKDINWEKSFEALSFFEKYEVRTEKVASGLRIFLNKMLIRLKLLTEF